MVLEDGQSPSPKTTRPMAERAWIRSVWAVLSVGVIAIFLYAAFQSGFAAFAATLTISLLLATACVLVGGLVGFLFGIPRSLQQQERVGTEPDGAESLAGGEDGGTGYRANTNLEQISDWLSKILVGVGLTQLGEIRTGLLAVAEFFGPALGGTPTSGPFAVVVTATFLTCGFLAGYLWTRLYLASAFSRADREAHRVLHTMSHTVSRMQERLSHQEDQAAVDANALSLMHRWLEPESGEPQISEQELQDTLRRASPSVKVHAFYRAQGLRSDTWQTDKELMERTIPIFQALAASNGDRFHRDYAQLGYALKDQRQPDWEAAFAALDKAIDIRGTWKENGWVMYEFNRAICRIELDDEFRAGRPSADSVTKAVVADLKVAAHSSYVREQFETQPVRDWLELNGIDVKDLAPVSGTEGRGTG